MREMLEKLWNEHFAQECGIINTNEERTFIKNAGELHKTVSELLTKEQSGAVEKYIESLYLIQSIFLKKAFFMGCEFAVSFLFEAGNFGKR